MLVSEPSDGDRRRELEAAACGQRAECGVPCEACVLFTGIYRKLKCSRQQSSVAQHLNAASKEKSLNKSSEASLSSSCMRRGSREQKRKMAAMEGGDRLSWACGLYLIYWDSSLCSFFGYRDKQYLLCFCPMTTQSFAAAEDGAERMDKQL